MILFQIILNLHMIFQISLNIKINFEINFETRMIDFQNLNEHHYEIISPPKLRNRSFTFSKY